MKLKVRGVEIEANRHTILVLDVRESFGPWPSACTQYWVRVWVIMRGHSLLHPRFKTGHLVAKKITSSWTCSEVGFDKIVKNSVRVSQIYRHSFNDVCRLMSVQERYELHVSHLCSVRWKCCCCLWKTAVPFGAAVGSDSSMLWNES